MKIVVDCRNLKFYPFAKPGFSGGTETYAKVLASGLAAKGHTVHVVTPDLDSDEQRGEREFWWPPTAHPTRAEVVVMVHSLEGVDDYAGDALVLASNGVDPPGLGASGKLAEVVSAFPVFSRKHGELLCKVNPTIAPEKCVVTGLGVDPPNPVGRIVDWKIPGRIWVGNDPVRGLWHVLDIFEIVQREYPSASLHVGYGFDQQIERHRWQQNIVAETLFECRRRMREIPNVVNLGQQTWAEVIAQQLQAQVHLWPSDPPNLGSQIHGLAQMECAAAGCALVLSDIEAFPEVFGEAATILPVPGTFAPDPVGDSGRRIDAQDYADVVLELMRKPKKWAAASRKSRKLAEKHTWTAVIERWQAMLEMLVGEEAKAA